MQKNKLFNCSPFLRWAIVVIIKSVKFKKIMKIRYAIIFIVGLATNFIVAQKGDLMGTIIDTDYNDVLPFANVIVKGSESGTTSDFEGKYEMALDAGSYTIMFSFIGYKTVEVSEVIIKAGEVTEINVNLSPLSNELTEVVVKAQTAKNTEASLLSVQKKSINLMDGISAQTFSKIGASNTAKAIKTVPGVSVQNGKYVYVRGLGDRYTKTILNGVDVPGLDPDRNTIRMDIFPTNILDNIQVIKSFTANLQADFTGGMVDIVTKDFPNRAEYSVTVGTEYRPDMHFNSNYLSYKGSKSQFLGYDSGSREMPLSREAVIPAPSEQNPKLSYMTSVFNPELKAKRQSNYMNSNIGFTAGNQYGVGSDNRLGYLASASYRLDYLYYEDIENNNYRKSADKSVNELELDKGQVGDIGRESVLFSGLAGLTFKTPKNKFKLTAMHIQNGISSAGYLRQVVNFTDAVTIFKDNLDYKQSQITNAMLSGKHSNESGSWNIEWKLAPTMSKIQDKDSRVTPFEYDVDTDTYFISESSAGSPSRYWRNLDELNTVGKIDLTYRHQVFNRKARLLFGGIHTYKQRDFSIDKYVFRPRGNLGQAYGGDADQLLKTQNIWTVSTDVGTYVVGNYEPTNTFDASQTIAGVYVSEEFQITERLKTILGLRLEKFDMFYTGQNNQGDIIYNNEQVQDKTDFFPAVNFIFGMNDETNIRATYGKTTARPSFKEASITQIFDPISSTTFNGNIDLRPTYINNFDVRYERFGTNAQILAVSAFYKNFIDPIELTYFASASDQFIPENLGSANVYGIEFEIRKNFEFFTERLKGLSINVNVSLIKSELKMAESELERRRLSLRDGETLSNKRELQGQSPYLVNAGLTYANAEKGWQTSLYYNVQGKTLRIVGTGDVPDAYSMPFNSLDYILNKSFGKKKRSTINFSIKNILDSELKSHYRSYKAHDKIFSKLSPGRGFSLGYSYNF